MGNLVLRRRVGEALLLYDAEGKLFGFIRVNAVEGPWVDLALDLPRDIAVVREELVGRERDNDGTEGQR